MHHDGWDGDPDEARGCRPRPSNALQLGHRPGLSYSGLMTIQQKIRMTVAGFLSWAETQPGRYELVDGEPVRLAPERARHNVVKGRVFRALDDTVREAGLSCQVFTDGMTVEIDAHQSREPDAAVQCGIKQDLDSVLLPAPVIVVEVASPSNPKMDTQTKLIDYFKVPSIQHYLIVQPDQPAVIHHKRDGDAIRTVIVTSGSIQLDPPGFPLPIAGFWPDAD
jgi:Uma2 family endonuclease